MEEERKREREKTEKQYMRNFTMRERNEGGEENLEEGKGARKE